MDEDRLRKLRHRGVDRVDWQLTFAATAYNLVRLRNLFGGDVSLIAGRRVWPAPHRGQRTPVRTLVGRS